MNLGSKFYLVLFIFLAASTMVFGQVTHTVDFEPDGVGADWDWTVSENSDNPPLEFIGNPVSGGINTSATVAKFTARQTGQPWALCLTSDDGTFVFDEDNSTISIMVYKSVISDIGFKVEGLSGNHQIIIPNTLTNQWEEITFDFSGQIGNSYNLMVIIPDFAAREQDNIIYFDNVQVPDGTVEEPPAGPTDAPATPAHDADNVLSIYSDAYTNLEGTEFNPPWGQSTAVTVDEVIADNNTIKYVNLNYQGTQFTTQDLSEYDYLHVDFWTPNSTTLEFFLISTGAESNYVLPITNETWVSVDIPLSHYTPPVNLADVFQFKVVGNGTVWFDNWYFWDDPTAVSSDASLSDLQIDGTTIANFNPETYSYQVQLPPETTEVPTVTATTNDELATFVINQAAEIPGTTEVVVTAEDGETILVYNVNFTLESGETSPSVNAPDPIPRQPEDLISIYSDFYTNIEGINYNPGWGQSGTVDPEFDIGTGNYILAYNNFNYQGTDFAANSQAASSMEYLHVDLWTVNATDVKVTPINAGTGAAEYLVNVPIINGAWSSVDLPIEDFIGMTWDDIIQLKFDCQAGVTPSDIYLDNIYFWKEPTPSGSDATLSDLQIDGTTIEGFAPLDFSYDLVLPLGTTEVPTVTATTNDADATFVINEATELPGTTEVVVTAEDGETMHTYSVNFFLAPAEPETAAADPVIPSENVISLFSNVYENVNVDTWSAEWDDADLEDIVIEENDTKLYTNLVVAGIEFTSETINISEMTHFHLDIWTPDTISDPATLNIKLVDFGADGSWGGDDDVEHELSLGEEIIASEQWLSLDLPLADFANLVTREHLAQLIISGAPNIVYIDNLFFYNYSNNAPDNDLEISKNFLSDNYPNPFTLSGTRKSAVTTIKFTLDEPAFVELKIYNSRGEEVRTLVENRYSANTHTTSWNGKDQNNRSVASGIYFYRLKAGKFTSTKKMILLK